MQSKAAVAFGLSLCWRLKTLHKLIAVTLLRVWRGKLAFLPISKTGLSIANNSSDDKDFAAFF